MLNARDYQRPFWRGLTHACLVAFYAMFLATLLLSLDQLFGNDIGVVIRFAFGIFLFIVSAAICGYLIFFEPMKKVLRQHFTAAEVMLGSTLGWLLIFLVIFLVGLVYSQS